MKRIGNRIFTVLLTSAILVLFAQSGFGQSLDETSDWLNAKLTPLFKGHVFGNVPHDFGQDSMVIATRLRAARPSDVLDDLYVKFENVTDVTWTRAAGGSFFEEKGAWVLSSREGAKRPRITFTGRFEARNREGSITRRATDTATLWLPAELTDAEVNSIVKAFKHLSALQGARLVKDDLF